MAGVIARVRKGFFWGPPSHRRIAGVGLLAGIAVLAIPLVMVVFGRGGAPVFQLAVMFLGLAEAGWGVELLPRALAMPAGWGRLARWLCALAGLVLGAISVALQVAPVWLDLVIAGTALALVLEMAPGSFANRA